MSRPAPASLAEALSQLQGRLPRIERGQTATVRSDRGAYSYRYADLAAVTEAVLPLLSELGLAWICRPTLIGDRFVLAYQLLHVSGEYVAGEYPLPAGGTPQAIGSAISYGRRYCLASVTGAVTTDDDDGQAAGNGPAEKPAAARTRGRRTSGKDPEPAGEKLSDGQRKAILAGMTELGLGGDANRAQRLTVCARLAGLEELASTSDLTADQARLVLDGIARRKREQVPPAEAS